MLNNVSSLRGTFFIMLNSISYKTGKALLFVASSFFLSNVSLGTFFIPNGDLGRPNGRTRRVKNLWTKGEDALLKAAVKKYGVGKWAEIASEIPGRMGNQCYIRWTNTVAPGISRKAWTPREDASLIEAVRARGPKWTKIARQIPGRTGDQCRYRYYGHLRPSQGLAPDGTSGAAPGADGQQETLPLLPTAQRQRRWTQDEDEQLIAGVEKYGTENWEAVAGCVSGRTRNQCYERWNNTLASGIHRGEWTPDEDALLIAGVEKYGARKWAKIASEIPDRTRKQCRTRYEYLKKSIRTAAVRAPGAAPVAASPWPQPQPVPSLPHLPQSARPAQHPLQGLTTDGPPNAAPGANGQQETFPLPTTGESPLPVDGDPSAAPDADDQQETSPLSPPDGTSDAAPDAASQQRELTTDESPSATPLDATPDADDQQE
ncbi:MAG: hypothetical protein LBH08_00105, partial [Puniceicoccales bacterium]|nr:hypothetical protein [Puniceicoccales bacterium]